MSSRFFSSSRALALVVFLPLFFPCSSPAQSPQNSPLFFEPLEPVARILPSPHAAFLACQRPITHAAAAPSPNATYFVPSARLAQLLDHHALTLASFATPAPSQFFPIFPETAQSLSASTSASFILHPSP